MKVYKELATGDLYAQVDGDLGRVIGITGEFFAILEPVVRVKKGSDFLKDRLGVYKMLNNNFSSRLAIPTSVLTEKFEQLPDLRAVQNTDIDELVAEYEAEECDYSDENIIQVAARSLRVVGNIGDSQSRCDLYVLANYVLKQQAEK